MTEQERHQKQNRVILLHKNSYKKKHKSLFMKSVCVCECLCFYVFSVMITLQEVYITLKTYEAHTHTDTHTVEKTHTHTHTHRHTHTQTHRHTDTPNSSAHVSRAHGVQRNLQWSTGRIHYSWTSFVILGARHTDTQTHTHTHTHTQTLHNVINSYSYIQLQYSCTPALNTDRT